MRFPVRTALLAAACGWSLAAAPVFAALEAGGTESPFLLGQGARALALGKAFTALADDESAVFWNPAGLGQLRQMEFGACHVFLNEGTSYDALGFVMPWYGLGTLGLSALNIQTGGIERRDDHDYLTGTFGYQQSQALLSFGREVFPGVHTGLNLKLERQAIDAVQGTGVGLDLGFLYNPRDSLSFGLMLQNVLPPEIRLVEPVTLPLSARLGMAYRLAADPAGNFRFLGTAEMEKPSANLVLLHGGAEVTLYHLLSLRAGWDRDRLLGGAGFSFQGLMLDYALTYRELSGYQHIASLNYRFGLSVDEAAKIRRSRLIDEVVARLTAEQFAAHRNEGAAALNRDQPETAVAEFNTALGWKADAQTSADLARAQAAVTRLTAQRYQEQGMALARERRWLEALAALRESLKLNTADEVTHAQIREVKRQATEEARAARVSGRQKKLRAQFLAALGAYFDGAYAQALAGWQAVLAQRPDYPQARTFYEQAQQTVLRSQTLTAVTDPKLEAQVQSGLAEAGKLYQARQYPQALAAWQKVLELDPTRPAARQGRDRAERIVKALRERGVE